MKQQELEKEVAELKIMKIEKVYIVTQNLSEDYHGVYESVLFVFKNKDNADNKIKELSENNNNYNIEYTCNCYNLE